MGQRDGRLHLVSCVSMKLACRAPAQELYVSPWFRKARAYVTKVGAPWRILSAKHGVLDPLSLVDPYERSLNTLSIVERRKWSSDVLEALTPTVLGGDRVVLLAGLRYREFLIPALEARQVHVDIPLAGRGLGMQLHWFDDRMRETDG